MLARRMPLPTRVKYQTAVQNPVVSFRDPGLRRSTAECGANGMPALVVFTMPQVVLSGAIQLRYAWMLDGPAWLDPAYWAMNAMSASADLNVLSGLHGAERFAW